LCDEDHIFPLGVNDDQKAAINRRYRTIRITQNVFPGPPPAPPAPPQGGAPAPSAA
jgi:hypothetical protein